MCGIIGVYIVSPCCIPKGVACLLACVFGLDSLVVCLHKKVGVLYYLRPWGVPSDSARVRILSRFMQTKHVVDDVIQYCF